HGKYERLWIHGLGIHGNARDHATAAHGDHNGVKCGCWYLIKQFECNCALTAHDVNIVVRRYGQARLLACNLVTCLGAGYGSCITYDHISIVASDGVDLNLGRALWYYNSARSIKIY